jgi:hypothetical protein
LKNEKKMDYYGFKRGVPERMGGMMRKYVIDVL